MLPAVAPLGRLPLAPRPILRLRHALAIIRSCGWRWYMLVAVARCVLRLALAAVAVFRHKNCPCFGREKVDG